MLRKSLIKLVDPVSRPSLLNTRLLACKQYRQRRYLQTAHLLSNQPAQASQAPKEIDQLSQQNQKKNSNSSDGQQLREASKYGESVNAQEESQLNRSETSGKEQSPESQSSDSDLDESSSVQSHFEKLLQEDDTEMQELDDETGMTVHIDEGEYDQSLSVRPRVIYFDTQKVYTSLKYSGFSGDQADMLMKTLRDMLYFAMSDCREHAVQLSTVQNEAYLFEAACSELRNEIQTDRTAQAESYRVNLARLSRDVEILRHEIEETINTMKSEIDMEVNERKNVTRAEESQIEMKIQELNNKITIDINSEIKSEIEALRWQTTRRGLVAIVVVACSILVATSATKKEEKRQQRRVGQVIVGDEYQVPVLTTSEFDEIEDRPIEVLTDSSRRSDTSSIK